MADLRHDLALFAESLFEGEGERRSVHESCRGEEASDGLVHVWWYVIPVGWPEEGDERLVEVQRRWTKGEGEQGRHGQFDHLSRTAVVRRQTIHGFLVKLGQENLIAFMNHCCLEHLESFRRNFILARVLQLRLKQCLYPNDDPERVARHLSASCRK